MVGLTWLPGVCEKKTCFKVSCMMCHGGYQLKRVLVCWTFASFLTMDFSLKQTKCNSNALFPPNSYLNLGLKHKFPLAAVKSRQIMVTDEQIAVTSLCQKCTPKGGGGK